MSVKLPMGQQRHFWPALYKGFEKKYAQVQKYKNTDSAHF